MLSLGRVPQPKIGSFRFNDDGTVTLSARPALASTMGWGRCGTERVATGTYSTTEAYVSDLMEEQDSSFMHDRNATNDEEDCRRHMAAKTVLRAVAHNYLSKSYRDGPFLVRLTDINIPNIFVDKDWNVTGIVDPEWLYAMPPESLNVPAWLGKGWALEQIKGEHVDEFDAFRKEFMEAFIDEQCKMDRALTWPLTKILQENWETRGLWFWSCLSTVNAATYLVEEQICRRFPCHLSDIQDSLYSLWCTDADKSVSEKLTQYQGYEAALKGLYNKS